MFRKLTVEEQLKLENQRILAMYVQVAKKNEQLKADLQKAEQANKINTSGLIDVNNRLRQLEV